MNRTENRRRRPNAKRERQSGSDCEAGSLPQCARGVPQILPEIAEQVAAGRSRCDRWRLMRLPERRHVSRQDILVPEVGERQPRGLIRRCSTGDQLPPTVIEMLRELFDDLGLAGRREAQRR